MSNIARGKDDANSIRVVQPGDWAKAVFSGEYGLEFSADPVKLLGMMLHDLEHSVLGVISGDVVGIIPDLLHDDPRG